MPARQVRLIAAFLMLAGFGLGTLLALRGFGPDGQSPGLSSEPRSNRAAKIPPDDPSPSSSSDPSSADAGAIAAPASGSDPSSPDAESAQIELGRAAYLQHCASCHGLKGEGQADWKIPNQDGSLPAPPHDISGHTWHHADAQLLEIIAQGGTVYMPESQMPGFSGLLSPAEMEATLAYIKRWWGPDELDFQAEVSAGWPTSEAPP